MKKYKLPLHPKREYRQQKPKSYVMNSSDGAINYIMKEKPDNTYEPKSVNKRAFEIIRLIANWYIGCLNA